MAVPPMARVTAASVAFITWRQRQWEAGVRGEAAARRRHLRASRL